MSLRKMERSIKHGKLKKMVLALVFSVAVFGMLPDIASAGVVPAAETTMDPEMRAEKLESIRTALEKKEVAARLADYGLTPEEVGQRLDELSDEQVAEVAAHADRINAGGDPLGTVLSFLLALILILVILHFLGIIDLGINLPRRKGPPEHAGPPPHAGPKADYQ